MNMGKLENICKSDSLKRSNLFLYSGSFPSARASTTWPDAWPNHLVSSSQAASAFALQVHFADVPAFTSSIGSSNSYKLGMGATAAVTVIPLCVFYSSALILYTPWACASFFYCASIDARCQKSLTWVTRWLSTYISSELISSAISVMNTFLFGPENLSFTSVPAVSFSYILTQNSTSDR